MLNTKMILCVRKDLKMSKGKMCAQCGHGAIGSFKIAQQYNAKMLSQWQQQGSKKIVLKLNDEEHLNSIKQQAQQANIMTHVVIDAGLTEVSPNTKTVLVLGPDTSRKIDRVTRVLDLM